MKKRNNSSFIEKARVLQIRLDKKKKIIDSLKIEHYLLFLMFIFFTSGIVIFLFLMFSNYNTIGLFSDFQPVDTASGSINRLNRIHPFSDPLLHIGLSVVCGIMFFCFRISKNKRRFCSGV